MIFGKKGKGSEQGTRIRQAHLGEEQDGYAFRRSRTLSGSLSDSVNSANAKRAALKSDRVKLHQLRSSHRKLKIMLLMAALICLGSGFLLSHSLAFATISVPENIATLKAEQDLRAALKTYVNSHPSEGFSLTLDTERATGFIQRSGHPEITGLTASINWFTGGDTVSFQFREPIALWRIDGEQYYVDKQGVVFQNYQGPKPNLQIEDASGYVSEMARQNKNMSYQFVSYLGQLAGELQKTGSAPIQRVVIPREVRQLNIYIKGHDYPIYANTMRSAPSQAKDIKLTLQYFKKQGSTPQYVDVRVAGKAFYK